MAPPQSPGEHTTEPPTSAPAPRLGVPDPEAGEPEFGQATQVLLRAGGPLSLGTTTFTYVDRKETVHEAVINPSFGYFFYDGMLLQVDVFLRFTSRNTTTSETTFNFGAGLGYAFNLSGRMTFLPLVGLRRVKFTTARVAADGSLVPQGELVQLEGSVRAFLLFHPAPHFVVGFGPVYTRSLHNEVDGRQLWSMKLLSLDATIGAWF